MKLDVKCNECKTDNEIMMLRAHFEFSKMNNVLAPYFNPSDRCYTFPTEVGIINLAPPTIGLQKKHSLIM